MTPIQSAHLGGITENKGVPAIRVVDQHEAKFAARLVALQRAAYAVEKAGGSAVANAVSLLPTD